MRIIEVFAVVILQISLCQGQDGILPPIPFTNTPKAEPTASLSKPYSEGGSILGNLDLSPANLLKPLPQQPIQQRPFGQQQPQSSYPQQQQPSQLPQPQLQQTAQYPQRNPTQNRNPLPTQGTQQQQQQQQQQPTQYPQQPKSPYPQQQPTQYPQGSAPSLDSLLTPQLPQAAPVDQSTSGNSNNISSSSDANATTTDTSNATESQNGMESNMMTTPTPVISGTTAATTTTTTTPEPEKTGMDQKNGEAESLVDYALGLAGYKANSDDNKEEDDSKENEEGESTSTLPETTTASPSPTPSDVSDCDVPASLESCGMPADAQSYFNFNVSVPGVLASIFKPEIARMLAQQCEPGSWCLPYETHQDIMDGMDKFYLEGPMCSVAMWSCMERIQTTRQTCEDKELKFLMASVQTLCNLSEFGLTEKGCYTRTTEALYATYVNTFSPVDNMTVEKSGNFCESYTAKMTKTYLCADDTCSYDQMIVLERFQPWKELVENATSVVTYCELSEICPYEEEEYNLLDELEQELEEEYADYAYNYYDSDYPEEGEEEEEEGEGHGDGEAEDDSEEGEGVPIEDMMGVGSASTNSGEQFGDVDSKKPDPETLATEENIVLGLIVLVTMAGVTVMCLVVVIYKRYQSSEHRGNRGYSKLMEKEGRMLHNEYS